MPETEQLTSKMLGGYRIERLLGKSQVGAAYLALEPESGNRVMVTTFNFPDGQATQEREQFRARFAREGAALTRLTHAHILPIYASGEQPGYLYLVTAFVKEASLGQILKQNTRLTPQQSLLVLRQLASGLDYAHGQGVVHGMLSLTNVVVNDKLEASIAGFGLHTMLEVNGNAQSARPLAHLSSSQGAFLGSPEYIAPERVLGLPSDGRVDIYALGVILFVLLSGVQPFRAATPLDIALQRLQQATPLVHEAYPDLPEAFDLVIGRALERDPARRFQNASELAAAFERVLKAQDVAQQMGTQFAGPAYSAGQNASDAQVTMPPTINWFDEQVTPSGRWEVAPSIGAERMRTFNNAPDTLINAGTLTSSPFDTQNAGNTSNSAPPATGAFAASPKVPGASLPGIDPFAWWSSRAGGHKQPPQAPSAPARRVSLRRSGPARQARPQPDQQGRRKVVTLAVVGVAAASVLTIGGVTFAHLTQSIKHPSQIANAPAPTATSPAAHPTTQPTRAATKAPTKAATKAPTQAPTKAPTKAPTQAPTHTGTVIGSTQLATNSSKGFSNPADGQDSLLIHLPNGKFVACERACTHVGVPVDYDPGSQMLVCPAHGAIFDPNNGFSHVSGPGNGPLASVTARVNGDGTITTG